MNIEQKIESLEGEIGLVKGEIKQTLVDLKDFIMKQGAPFSTSGELPKFPTRESHASSENRSSSGASHDVQDRHEPKAPLPNTVDHRSKNIDQETGMLTPSDIRKILDQSKSRDTQQTTSKNVVDLNPPPRERGVTSTGSSASDDVGDQKSINPNLLAPGESLVNASALDANLLTNLTRWVGGVKRRLGSEQLAGLLEIYKMTGHLPEVIENLIFFLAGLDALPDESSDQVFTLDDLMDSLLQLHAVVYGPGYASGGSLLSDVTDSSVKNNQ